MEQHIQQEQKHETEEEAKRKEAIKFQIGLRLLGPEREKRFLAYLQTVQSSPDRH